MKKQVSATYLVGQKLMNNEIVYIHELKRTCKCNNPMQRIKALRDTFKWNIDTIHEGRKNGVEVYHYKLTAIPRKFPKQFKN